MRIEHFALNVENPPAVAQWYVDHLGMRIARKADNAAQIHFIVDSAGQGLIELYHNTEDPVPDYFAMHPQRFHVAFASSDIEGDLARLVSAGAAQEGDITVTPAGDRLAFLRDPWGLCLQLAQRAAVIV